MPSFTPSSLGNFPPMQSHPSMMGAPGVSSSSSVPGVDPTNPYFQQQQSHNHQQPPFLMFPPPVGKLKHKRILFSLVLLILMKKKRGIIGGKKRCVLLKFELAAFMLCFEGSSKFQVCGLKFFFCSYISLNIFQFRNKIAKQNVLKENLV